MQHHLGTNLFKGGVYEPTKTVETFSCGKDRYLAPMEVRAIPARDWACLWQATSHHSQDIVAMWRHSSRRSRLALTLAEREDISRGIASDSSIREIARLLKRPASTVSREVARQGGRPAYRAHDADRRAWVSALRPKRCLLAGNRRLREVVASKLILDWSPEQISGWLKTCYPNNESMHVSHETIYRSLFIQARGVLKKELMDHLRSKRRMRRSRHASEHGHSRGQIVDAISIRERPAEAEERAIPGHWEGDLLAGGKNSYIATLVERHSRFLLLDQGAE
jgi:IS30 family transposase